MQLPCSPCPSVDKKGLRCPPRPSVDKKKAFFAPLRAPSRTKKVFFLPLRGLLWRPNLDAIALFSLPLRGQKGSKMSSAPLRGQKKVFFAPLRAPSRKKKVFFLPLRGLLWRPNLDAIALFSLPLRGQEGSKMFSVPLRGPPWTKRV